MQHLEGVWASTALGIQSWRSSSLDATQIEDYATQCLFICLCGEPVIVLCHHLFQVVSS